MKRNACSKKSLFGSEVIFEYEFSPEGVELYFSKIQANAVVKSNVYAFTNQALPSVVRLIQSAGDLGLPIRLNHPGISVIVADLWESHDIPGWAVAKLLSKLVRRLCDVQQESSCDQLIRDDSAARDVRTLEVRNQRLSDQLAQAQSQITNQSHSLNAMQTAAEKSSKEAAKTRKTLRDLSVTADAFSTTLLCLSRAGVPTPQIVEKPKDVFVTKKASKPLPTLKAKTRTPVEVLSVAAEELKKSSSVEGAQAIEGEGLVAVTAFRSKWSEALKNAGVYVYKGYSIPIKMSLL